MTEPMLVNAYEAMGPLSGAEERIWRRLDGSLGGKAKECSVCIGGKRRVQPALVAAAAVLVLVLLAVLAARRLPGEGETQPIPAATPVPEEEVETAFRAERREIRLVNATVDGQSSLRLEEDGEFLARAVLPEGTAVDHWRINGQPVDAQGRSFSLRFDSAGVEEVEAVLREEKTVRCGENAYLRFLDETGTASGEMYSTVCFEYDYVVPTTGQLHAGGVISAYVSPIIPRGRELDYWVVDGQRVEAEQNPRGILLENLDHSVVIDAVLKDSNRREEKGAELVLTGGEASIRPADDLPANESSLPENTAWERLDLPRDGIPFDADAPARDGHVHQWEQDPSRSWSNSCASDGQSMLICSVCGREYCLWLPQLEHQYQRVSENGWYYDECVVCGYRKVVYYSPYGGGSILPPTPTPQPIYPVIPWDNPVKP